MAWKIPRGGSFPGRRCFTSQRDAGQPFGLRYRDREPLDRAALLLRESTAVLIAAGAGFSVDSGLPDFRGTEGFWRAYPPIAKLGLSFTECSNPEQFEVNPRFAWAFWGHRIELYEKTAPHPGYRMLLNIARGKPGGYFVFTSNVDGHFEKAGFDPDRVYECHGRSTLLQCTTPCGEHTWPSTGVSVDIDPKEFQVTSELPRCPQCGAVARTNVLMFGDGQWVERLTEAQGERLEQWLTGLGAADRLVVLEFGAGQAVRTVRSACERIVRGNPQSALIRVNPVDTEVPYGQASVPMTALAAIQELCHRMEHLPS